MENKGILIVVSGFSGAGKGTIMKQLMDDHEDKFALSVSATTRAPRDGEEHGREYFFVAAREFEAMIEGGDLIEHAKYVNHYYGTPKEYVKRQLDSGKDVILEIEIQGALQVKEVYPEAVLLFVTPPNAAELRRRLINRATEDEAVIKSRLQRAVEEAEGADHYDYLVVNDELEACVRTVYHIIEAEHMRMARNQDRISAIKEELSCYTHPTRT